MLLPWVAAATAAAAAAAATDTAPGQAIGVSFDPLDDPMAQRHLPGLK